MNDWTPAYRSLVYWFTRSVSEIPREPFDLWPWARVTGPERFLAVLRLDVERGPDGPRARRGALQSDLRRLHQLFGVNPSAADGTAPASPAAAADAKRSRRKPRAGPSLFDGPPRKEPAGGGNPRPARESESRSPAPSTEVRNHGKPEA